MALECVVFQPDPFSNDLNNLLWGNSKGTSSSSSSSSAEVCNGDGLLTGDYLPAIAPVSNSGGRGKRRRKKKNEGEKEKQRMTHIAVERNRRKQMNDYLAVLRSLMPPSFYSQRGDQASTIGGAINYVKELEQLVQLMEAHKERNTNPQHCQVEMVETHANIKVVLSKRGPKQLLKMVTRLHSLGLTTLHLNLTTIDDMVFYSFNVKIEDGCEVKTVNEIAATIDETVAKIQEESMYQL